MSVLLRISSYWVRPRTQHLILHVTDKCNLRCKHCFVDLTERNTLDNDTTRSIAGDLGSILWLDIGGGEPYLLDNLPELIAPFDCEVLGIPTNGHDPKKVTETTQTILDTAQARDIVVGVSIEGFQEEHTEIRRNRQNYDLAFESLRALRELANRNPRLRVKCNTVITNRNTDRLIEFMEYMRSGGLIDFHSVIMMRSDPHKPDIALPYLDKLKELRPAIFRVLDSYLWGNGPLKRNFLRRYYRFLWDVSLGNLERNTQVIPCTGGQTHLVIWATGDVASCELLPPFGNIHELSLPEILGGKAKKVQVDMIRRRGCSCTHNCVLLDSILFNPRNYPKLLVS